VRNSHVTVVALETVKEDVTVSWDMEKHVNEGSIESTKAILWGLGSNSLK